PHVAQHLRQSVLGTGGRPRLIPAVVQKRAERGLSGRRVLPFRLGGRPLAAPSRIGIRLVVAHVRHLRLRLELSHAGERVPTPRPSTPISVRPPAKATKLSWSVAPSVRAPFST